MYLRTITVRVPRKIIEQFKQQAKEAFPKETFAYLLGRDAGTLVEIEDLFTPMDVDEYCSERGVSISFGWLPAAKKEAAIHDLKVVGDIHSHPFRHAELGKMMPGCAPSEEDISEGLPHVFGICQVRQCSSGRLVSNVRFFGPMFPVVEEVH